MLHEAYVTEAALVGAEDFPPLGRTVEDFMASDNQFFAYHRDGLVCGVIELELLSGGDSDGTLIASLGVSPDAFRRGIGRALAEHALQLAQGKLCVSTAELNEPAIRLYQSVGFAVRRRYTAADGTPLVELENRPR